MMVHGLARLGRVRDEGQMFYFMVPDCDLEIYNKDLCNVTGKGLATTSLAFIADVYFLCLM